MNLNKTLTQFRPSKKFFVGIDSDGCVFDSMGIKQRECFCPWMIACFGLQPVADAARECKEFADLFSKTRGANRHKTIIRILKDLLPKHPKVAERGFIVPKFEHYVKWVNDPKSILSTAGLKKSICEIANKEAKSELEIALNWSLRVDQAVAEIVRGITPFPFVRESLEKLALYADIVVISATPLEAIIREWTENGIVDCVRFIAGQEMGAKAQQLASTSKGKYDPSCVLMIGDAPGDFEAAKANNSLFYPINPNNEVLSWQRFMNEGIEKFIAGTFAGAYEFDLITEFEQCLPVNPPWYKQ